LNAAGLTLRRVERLSKVSVTRFCPVVIALIAAAAGLEVEAQDARPHGLLSEYFPAFCRSAVYPASSCKLVIFREGSRQSAIDIPIRPDFFTFARGGTALYALSILKKPACLYEVELSPVRTTRFTCPVGLISAYDFATSANGDQLFISGPFKAGETTRCGVFEVSMSEGPTRQVLTEVCGSGSRGFENSWSSLSLSPDGGRAVAVRHDRLELVDVAAGISRAVADGISSAAWSPDGRWIAARKLHGGTDLLDSTNFKKKRSLADSTVQWSPDSRYLLRIEDCFFPIAVNGVGTVQALDVATGKKVTIESSRCVVDGGGTGWVSGGVAQ
jgi:hypothetical protein